MDPLLRVVAARDGNQLFAEVIGAPRRSKGSTDNLLVASAAGMITTVQSALLAPNPKGKRERKKGGGRKKETNADMPYACVFNLSMTSRLTYSNACTICVSVCLSVCVNKRVASVKRRS